MCGIAGFYGQFDPLLLQKMKSFIAARGPDQNGDILLQSDNFRVGLAHQRLSIIDLSSEGTQPMTVRCACCNNETYLKNEKKMWLTYNGEIYNYKQLRNELEGKGHTFFSQTDTEVILHLYAEEGYAMLEKLNGIFALALFDGRTKRLHSSVQPGDLLVARDGVGVKPLYYSQTKSGFLFASELKALLASNEVPREIDLNAINYYLTYLWSPGEKTALSSVKKINPGEALIIRSSHIFKRWEFYDLPYGRSLFNKSEKEISNELIDKLMNAVDRQLISDVPMGAFLSGGLDSSSLVACMKQLRPQESIKCYTIGFPENKTLEDNPNDLPYAIQVAKHLKVDLNIIKYNEKIYNDIDFMLYHLDEPQADLAALNVYTIAKAARQDGIKVLISGSGGDDIFTGYRRHQALQMEKVWMWLPFFIKRKIAKLSNNMLDGNSSYNMQLSGIRRFAKLFSTMDLPIDQRIVNSFMWSTKNVRNNIFSEGMNEFLNTQDTTSPLLNSLKKIPSESTSINKMLYLDGKHFLADHNLNYTDKMSMAGGIEVRVPLLDLELIDFATRIPSDYKQKGGMGKAIFKRTMEPYLPRSVIYRQKSGFGVPLRQWVKNELYEKINDTLSSSAIKRRGIFDYDAIKNLIKLNQTGKIDASYTIFSLFCIEKWCNLFIDSGSNFQPL